MKINIYGTIGSSLWGPSVSAADVIAQLDADPDDPVALYINSGGGDVFDGIAIYNALKRHNGRVTVHIDGLAASAASVIAMAGDEIIMPANTMIMVHNPWIMAMGGAGELRKTADILDQTRDAIVSAYRDKTGLEEEDLKTLLDDETWMSAQAAVDWGFASRVDAPLEEDTAARAFASLDYTRFKQVPGAIAAMAQRATSTAAAAANSTGDTMKNEQPAATDARPEIDVNAIKAQAKREERERCEKILAMGQRVNLDRAKIDAIIAQDVDIAGAQGLVIDAIADQQRDTMPVIAGVHAAAAVQKDAADKYVEAVTQALCARAGLEKSDTKNPYRSMSLMELGKEDLRRKGVNASGNKLEIAAQIFAHAGAANHGTGDFPNILKDVSHKSMLRGYDESEETFQEWTYAGELPDFKPGNRVALNSFPSLRKVNAGAEYKYATFGDTGESIVLATYGELFAITRQAIINDDLNSMVRLPRNMGRAAARTIGDLVYSVLIDNTQVISETGQVIFESGTHKNTGTNILSDAGLTLARTAMRKQRGPGGASNLNIRPAFLIAPAALETRASVLMASEVKVGGTNGEPNPHSGLARVIVESRLDDAASNGSTAYFLAANPSIIDTIEVAYLDGVQAPFLDQQAGWGVDGVEFKVRIDAGVRALGFRGLYRSIGTGGS